LIAKLQGIDSPEKGLALEYAYINVSDEYREGKSSCSLILLLFYSFPFRCFNYVLKHVIHTFSSSDHTRLGVWILDGEPAHSNLLRFALNQETLPHTMVMLVVSMTTPWNIIDELHNWASVLQDHIDSLNIGAHDYQVSEV
jgi:Dynein light intermediate chain (DLIC).